MTEEEFAELEKLEAKWVAIERQQEPDPQFWRWSPTPLPKVREMMATADLVLDSCRFFDAGCGIGTKMALAEGMFGWQAFGWDLYEEYIQVARNELGMRNAMIGDLRAGDPVWQDYDVIMTSRPFKDDDEEEAFERKVQAAMKPGAVLIGTHLAAKPYPWRWLYRAPWRVVAVKPLPGEQDHTHANVPGMNPLA